MEYIIILYVIIGLLCGFTIFILIKNKKIKKELKNSKNSITSLTLKIDETVDILSTGKTGFYIGSTTLLSEEDRKNGVAGEKYGHIIYIKELDRYTNGMSKIQFTSIEVTSGYHHDQYSWVKTCEKDRFSSLKETDKIEWLESEEDIKESRRKKLAKILKPNK